MPNANIHRLRFFEGANLVQKSEARQSLVQQLRAAYAARHRDKKKRSIALPTENGMAFLERGDTIHITVGEAGTIGNMQTNGSAFEAWALSLHVWLEKRICIEWITPRTSERERNWRHYQRFLYRMRRFHDLFGDKWLTIPRIDEANACSAVSAERLYINVSGDRDDSGTSENAKREAQAEIAFLKLLKLNKPPFSLKLVDRQFPVGVFEEESPTIRSAIFTGGKSAIDLIGSNADAISVFELKTGKNLSVGKLSELLFYVHVLKDACGTNPRFLFAKSDRPPTIDFLGCKSINAILLVEHIHPLLEHPGFKTLLDAAFASHGMPVASRGVPVRFQAWTYEFDEIKDVSNDPSNTGDLPLSPVEEWQ